ncbi:hypothetical protein F5Y18DRAFT_401614 [Xylariaceae sp. FL1019]|nr:hypothetical protein F5Y18DRAFT_401614 [Xylariaceae sp. FL1019]
MQISSLLVAALAAAAFASPVKRVESLETQHPAEKVSSDVSDSATLDFRGFATAMTDIATSEVLSKLTKRYAPICAGSTHVAAIPNKAPAAGCRDVLANFKSSEAAWTGTVFIANGETGQMLSRGGCALWLAGYGRFNLRDALNVVQYSVDHYTTAAGTGATGTKKCTGGTLSWTVGRSA